MRHERIWSPSILFLPLAVIISYALVTTFGLLWPEKSVASIVASIVVSIGLFVVVTLWLKSRTRWWRTVCIILSGATFLFPMVGAATLGTDLALEREADLVTGRVADIDVVETGRADEESFRTTYTFVATDDGRDLGTVAYRGDKEAYELEVGEEVELLADPDGELPLKLADEVDSGTAIGMLVVGGFLFAIIWAIGVAWPAVRRALG